MKKILFICLLVFLSIMPANALTFTLNSVTGISNPISEGGVDYFYTAEGTTIKKYDVFQGSYSPGVYDVPSRVIDVYIHDGYYYYVTLNGIVYRTTLEDYYLQFDSNVDTGNTVSLSQPYTSTQYNSNILVDNNGDVFVHDGADKIYFIDSSTRTSSLWFDYTSTIRTIYPTDEGEGIGFTTSDGLERNYVVTNHASNTASLIYSGTAPSYNIGYRLTNGYLVGSCSSTNVLVLRQLYENKSIMGNITLTTAIGSGVAVNAEEIIVFDDGIILYMKPDSNVAICSFATFTTLDDIGGYSYDSSSGDSSSSDSSSDNPLDLGDTHEWTNEEIATSARQIVPPIFYMVLIFFFLFAIGGN